MDPIILYTPINWYKTSIIIKLFLDHVTNILNTKKDLGRKFIHDSYY